MPQVIIAQDALIVDESRCAVGELRRYTDTDVEVIAVAVIDRQREIGTRLIIDESNGDVVTAFIELVYPFGINEGHHHTPGLAGGVTGLEAEAGG